VEELTEKVRQMPTPEKIIDPTLDQE